MPANKITLDDARRIVGDGPGRRHLERFTADREAEDEARAKARRDAEATTPRYPWQSDADRAALIEFAVGQAVAAARFARLPAIQAIRADAEAHRRTQEPNRRRRADAEAFRARVQAVRDSLPPKQRSIKQALARVAEQDSADVGAYHKRYYRR